jgi:hypothetical protein
MQQNRLTQSLKNLNLIFAVLITTIIGKRALAARHSSRRFHFQLAVALCPSLFFPTVNTSHTMEKSLTKHSPASIEKDEEEGSICPLFMHGLPTNFNLNPDLAALASLMANDSSVNDAQVKNKSHINVTNTKPHSIRKKMSIKCKLRHERIAERKIPVQTTLSEAQLFLKLWKL